MSENILALFPGQGSQKVGMGQALVQAGSSCAALAKEYFERADQALGFKLSEICFSGPAERLTATEIAQPAILTVSTICYQLAQTNNRVVQPKVAAGHSLGEYSALVAAQALEFEQAVVLVHKRGRYMQSAVAAGVGKMSAVIGLEVDALEDKIAQVTDGIVQIANINAPGQIVVSGEAAAVDQLTALLSGVKVMPLSVSAPFHSSLMEPAAFKLKQDLDAVKISAPKFPIISNFSATAVSQPEEIRKALYDQVCGRVRWVESINYAVQNFEIAASAEFGEGAVLSGMIKRITASLKRNTFGTPQELGC